MVVGSPVYLDYLRKVTQSKTSKVSSYEAHSKRSTIIFRSIQVSSFHLLELYLLYDTVLLFQATVSHVITSLVS